MMRDGRYPQAHVDDGGFSKKMLKANVPTCMTLQTMINEPES